jgi:septum formation protein
MPNASWELSEPLWLASASPRRTQLLREAGIQHEVIVPVIDDGRLQPGGCEPVRWVMSLAYLKARAAAEGLRERGVSRGLVLGADTVCALSDGRILGQAASEGTARDMIRSVAGTAHQTITGVCVLSIHKGMTRRLMVHDAAVVHVGDLTADQVEEYVVGGTWRGKAGAYNLAERVAAGWPIVCEGDPTTVMGLPMRRLPGWLRLAGGLWESSA